MPWLNLREEIQAEFDLLGPRQEELKQRTAEEAEYKRLYMRNYMREYRRVPANRAEERRNERTRRSLNAKPRKPKSPPKPRTRDKAKEREQAKRYHARRKDDPTYLERKRRAALASYHRRKALLQLEQPCL